MGGDKASAQSLTTDSIDPSLNSQNLAILEPNIPLVSKDNTPGDAISGGLDLNIVSDSAILPMTGPLGVSDGTDPVDLSVLDTSIYVVRKGDSISAIADMYGVSVNTILLANDMKKGEKLVEGDVLLILPISGIEHTVKAGQTLASIAKTYGADVEDILYYNDLAIDSKLTAGEVLIIPGGDMNDEGGDKPAANLASTQVKDKNYYAKNPIKSASGYFINPVPTGRKTQGLHGPGHRGIDIGAPVGSNIYASAPGTVLVVKSGCVAGNSKCGGGYGNMVIVQHPNGTKTLYAHMVRVNTKIGAKVSQGSIIGYVGNTGHSTGPHLHFEVFNAKNPGADWSWAK